MSLVGGVLDRTWGLLAGRFGALGGPLVATRLSALRRQAALDVIEEHRALGAELEAMIEAGDNSARTALARVADRALDDMRLRVSEAARDRGGLIQLAEAADARWRESATETSEYLDDENLDEALRQNIMADLDAINDAIGSYGHFLDAIRPLMRASGTTRVLDLAAGHGGFALSAARAARDLGLDIHFTASDIKREYLDLGAARAAEEGLDIGFEVQDALDLGNLEPNAYDVIVCTQSIHHFPAGLVAVMFQEAARAASRGVVFLDGCRSAAVGMGVVLFGTVRHRNMHLAHDGWVSSRRFFVPEELELLARIGPWGDGVEARFVPVAHCLLRLQKF